jgi:regulation of enolase protein 1 (concanavalin A-like superfamily)
MTRHIWISLSVIAFISFIAISLRAAPDQGETIAFEEKFDGKLSDGWSWLRETPAAWKVAGGELVLTVQPNYLHPFGKDARNVLLRDLSGNLGASWAVEVKLESDPKVQYEHAGVLIFWDEDNYISIWRESLDGKPKLQMVTTKNNSPGFVVLNEDIKPVWLRLVVNGDDVTTQYRASEKDAWKTVGKSKRLASANPRCGLASGGAPKDAQREAKVSHFQVVRLAGG